MMVHKQQTGNKLIFLLKTSLFFYRRISNECVAELSMFMELMKSDSYCCVISQTGVKQNNIPSSISAWSSCLFTNIALPWGGMWVWVEKLYNRLIHKMLLLWRRDYLSYKDSHNNNLDRQHSWMCVSDILPCHEFTVFLFLYIYAELNAKSCVYISVI